MNILTISGSARADSSNLKLLDSLALLVPQYSLTKYEGSKYLPMFFADLDRHPIPKEVVKLRSHVDGADAVIISTPEYIHNIPAQLKNILEWLTSSGNLVGKKVLPITFTPHAPRGEKAMQSLLWSLTALDAQILPSLSLYKTDVTTDNDNNFVFEQAVKELLLESLSMLES